MTEFVNMIDLTKLLEAVIIIIFALTARYFIPWLKTALTNEQMVKLKSLVQIGVYAAEKLYGAGNGSLKFDHVKAWLESKGFTVDEEQLKVLVDAEIKQMELLEMGESKALTE